MTKYYSHRDHIHPSLIGIVVDADWTPTQLHYGTIITSVPVENPDRFGLVEYSDDLADFMAECAAEYRAASCDW